VILAPLTGGRQWLMVNLAMAESLRSWGTVWDSGGIAPLTGNRDKE